MEPHFRLVETHCRLLETHFRLRTNCMEPAARNYPSKQPQYCQTEARRPSIESAGVTKHSQALCPRTLSPSSCLHCNRKGPKYTNIGHLCFPYFTSSLILVVGRCLTCGYTLNESCRPQVYLLGDVQKASHVGISAEVSFQEAVACWTLYLQYPKPSFFLDPPMDLCQGPYGLC